MNNYFELRLEEDEIRAISSIGLAHLGDAVYELLVRAWLCAHGKATGKGLHRSAVELVKAPAPAARAERILPMLTEEELRRCCGNVIRAILDSAVQRDYIDDYQN